MPPIVYLISVCNSAYKVRNPAVFLRINVPRGQALHRHRRLNVAAVHSDYDKEKWYPFPPDTIDAQQSTSNPNYHVQLVNAIFHESRTHRGSQLERKMVVGTILAYKKPSTTGSVSGMQVTTRNAAAQQAGSKRIKSGVHSMSPTSRLLMVADAFPNSSHVFALVIVGPMSIFNSCGQTSLANDVRVGDLIGVYEPSLVTRRLGDAIPIFDDWNRLVLFRRNISLPPKIIQKSSVANQQVHFYAQSLTVELSNARLLTGMAVPCFGTTCDRQDPTCPGCHLGSAPRKNLVLKVMVEILDQPQYESETGLATFSFQSYAFTDLMIDVQSLSTLDCEQMRNHDLAIRRAVSGIQTYINAHGGWTVIGWHRRGTVTTMDESGVELNSYTQGHLVRLEPTILTNDNMSVIRSLRYTAAP